MKKIRIFAGPNGSGKSTLYKLIAKDYPHVNLGCFVNADEIKKSFDENGYFNLHEYGIKTCSHEEFLLHYRQSTFTKSEEDLLGFELNTNGLLCSKNPADKEFPTSYFCAAVADYCRHKLLAQSDTFSCETVFSHPSKLELLKKAKEQGFEVYLYFVSLADPQACVNRVVQRAETDGHNVPADKIIERYRRVMELLYSATVIANRVFFLSNDETLQVFAEKTRDDVIHLDRGNRVPAWFLEYLIHKMIDC